MQTRFTDAQRQDPAIRTSEAILRNCVHCGFCSATCPTYALLGDELDSPRGRIYLIKDMLESGRPATAEVVRHVDRCLSCLACMTTCPSGVHYQHLVDHARAHIEATYRRPLADRWLRRLLAAVMPYPSRFRYLLALARIARPLAPLLPRRLRAALALVPAAPAAAPTPAPTSSPPVSLRGAAASAPAPAPDPSPTPAATRLSAAPAPRARVAVMSGCVQSVLGGTANAATLRLLERIGCDVVPIAGCCGSLTHHLGKTGSTRDFAAAFSAAVVAADAGSGLDAVVVNASGCGTHLKDYGFIFRDDAALASAAATVSRLARDITELVAERGLPGVSHPRRLKVAYHSACSLQHGQGLDAPPRELLRAAGYEVVEIPEGHLCCGSAGTYNMLQPELAERLAARKLAHVAALDVDVLAAGNLGCLTQLATGARVPVVHTVELLDWATGGPVPPVLAGHPGRQHA